MVHNAQWTTGFGSASKWSRSQDKIFEQSLVLFPEATPDRWERIAAQIPGKSAPEVWNHYEDLVHDVMEIDAGRVDLPRYEEDSPSSSLAAAKAKGRDAERRKGVPWTEQEHILFLAGLEKYGKGDWRSISRNSVVTRTPTQVASHAQKYFLRLNADGSSKKEKKRSSIHDITGAGPSKIQSSYQNWAGPGSMEPIESLEPFRDQRASFGYHGIGY